MGLDHEGTCVACLKALNSKVHLCVGFIGELNFLGGSTFVLLEWAEGDGIVWIRVGAGASPCGIGCLGAGAVLTTG